MVKVLQDDLLKSKSTNLPILNRKRTGSWTTEHPTQSISLILTWYFFSTTATFINKILIKQYHFPAELLTVIHLFIGTSCDALLLFTPTSSKLKVWHIRPISRKGFILILPLSLMAITAKTLTYWSYQTVPVAVAHTAKASSPLYNVFLMWLIYSKKYNGMVYLSLIPIVVGVALASISEFGINELGPTGVFCAVCASFISVIQNMYSKYLLIHSLVSDSINLHFYNGLLSVVINLPWLMYTYWDSPLEGISTHSQMIFFCGLLQFLGSLTSYYLLGKSTELTYSVLGTLKRICIIFSALIYFGNPITPNMFLGIMLTIVGIGSYQYAKRQAIQHRA